MFLEANVHTDAVLVLDKVGFDAQHDLGLVADVLVPVPGTGGSVLVVFAFSSHEFVVERFLRRELVDGESEVVSTLGIHVVSAIIQLLVPEAFNILGGLIFQNPFPVLVEVFPLVPSG